jgi:CxC2 like cysteine cluster associated with KDZ transposases
MKSKFYGLQRQRDYIMEYVDRIDSLLESLLSRESLNDGDKHCRHCDQGYKAIWRCKDCSLAVPVCRGCMRASHKDNPFHRIEKWTGNYFRSAYLWEVGTFLLVRHHVGTPLCGTLIRQQKFLERVESGKDMAEQEILCKSTLATTPAFNILPPAPVIIDETSIPTQDNDLSSPAPISAYSTITPLPAPVVIGETSTPAQDNDQSEEEFMRFLNDLRNNADAGHADFEETANIWEMEDDVEVEEIEAPNDNHYLPAEDHDGYPTALPVGSYLRVVHTNGIHDIAMVSCECQGHNMVPGDLLAARLLPASFQRIRTLFTVPVLDNFRLCNLELKASAYQFYQLLRRLTAPMTPAAVVDLYREFRRMSRIWRWMKRLKWAGLANNDMPVNEVKEGELGIFCPACPQPGVNIPDQWMDDKNRWVYKRVFVADGNFKADHVRQKKEAGDVWLSEGGGMIPERQEYMSFLKYAIERLTVSASIFINVDFK